MRSYRYSPLFHPSHIRIIALEASADKTSPLHCSIQQISINNLDEEYETISYTWGAPIFSHSIYTSDDTVLNITANLHAALQRFRLPYGIRRLWADSICINQKDNDEKTVQIQLMRQIYRNANRVLVWLGEGQDGEDMAVRFLCKATKGDELIVNGIIRAGFGTLSLQIQRLFNMAWFSRRWIIQEVALNSDVVLFCRRAEISWIRLIQALNIIAGTELLQMVDSRTLESLMMILEIWKSWSLRQDREETRPGLVDLLCTFGHFGCADDRDRIYALSALAQYPSSKPPRFDEYLMSTEFVKSTQYPPVNTYNDGESFINYSASVEEVYTSFALNSLRSDPNPMHLFRAAGMYSGNQTLPSWVPDWRQPQQSMPPVSPKVNGRKIYVCGVNRQKMQVDVRFEWFSSGYMRYIYPYELHRFDYLPMLEWLEGLSLPAGTGISGFRSQMEDLILAYGGHPKVEYRSPRTSVFTYEECVALHQVLVGNAIFYAAPHGFGICPKIADKNDLFITTDPDTLILRPVYTEHRVYSRLPYRLVGTGMLTIWRPESNSALVTII